jgi:hypothetical protein
MRHEHSLPAVQARLREALLADGDGLADIFGSTAERFAVHRRHFIHSLTHVLAKTFPAVVSLVDERFFAFMVDSFVRQHPPRTPCLYRYGEEFPAFLSTFPPSAHLSYLAEVARFEWVIHSVFHADAEASSQHFESAVPVDAIWRMALGRDGDDVDLHRGPAHLVIYRSGDDVLFEPFHAPLSRMAMTKEQES